MFEKKVLNQFNEYYNEDLMPLIEIMKRETHTDWKRDEDGKILRKVVPGQKTSTGKQKMEMVHDETTKRDITIKNILEELDNKNAFIDYFRFSPSFYDNNFSENMEWSLEISSNWNKYISCFDELIKIRTLFPVLTLKESTHIKESELELVIDKFKSIKKVLALRVTAEYYYNHRELIEDLIKKLRITDYLMFDIHENEILGYEDDIRNLFRQQELKCHKIILNSPRRRDLFNSKFDEGISPVAINKPLIDYGDYYADGFGDYVGIADNIESEKRGYHGATVIYNIKNESHYSFRVNGKNFKQLKRLVIGWDQIKEPQYKECEGIARVYELNFGWFGDWKEVSMLSYMNAILLLLGIR
jgi:hypothetical protein